ncbi:MAG TPA: tetratricopeptide repeat protein [Candidatus Paceibacterota bacterium]|nr:tetratricopeptide repeat protein [Verrucomicrobiota bacterium]HSA11201.1 tetratricopeptide repeat protein [Candidatus Paceibacterota bacterium]
MLTIKNRAGSGDAGTRETSVLNFFKLATLAAMLLLLAGCTPSGPRALLEGQRLIAEGDYPRAIEKLKAATVLLGGTNAQAWNDLGLAYHHAGEVAEAQRAYQRALTLNHDLSEARFNLGCLWLGQNKPEVAKAEFTAYTLRRPNAVQGFLKLGAAQLRTREPGAAEKSFNEALRLSPQNPEALNGLGLARLGSGRAGEAARCFEAALKQRTDYRPALLNLAIVAHQHLRDHRLALQKYREYLALMPPPANADALAATVRQLEQELTPPSRRVATNGPTQSKAVTTPSKPVATNVARISSTPKPVPASDVPKPAAVNVPKRAATNMPKPAPAVVTTAPSNVEVVRIPEEPALRPGQEVAVAPSPTQASTAAPLSATSPATGTAGTRVAKRGFFGRINPLNLLRSGDNTPVRPTPLGSASSAAGSESVSRGTTATEPAAASHAAVAPGDPSARYGYRTPTPPAPGNRSAAERLFAQGVQLSQAHRLPEAIQAYRAAVQKDPTFFEAHYNLGLAATQAGNLPLALSAYENALAVQPASLDARYNFALVLKQANHLSDAVVELDRILAKHPNEVRAHLALGNLYAQQLQQPAKARQHYLKVLEVDPRHPQASAINFWLAANPP